MFTSFVRSTHRNHSVLGKTPVTAPWYYLMTVGVISAQKNTLRLPTPHGRLNMPTMEAMENLSLTLSLDSWGEPGGEGLEARGRGRA